MSLLLIYRVSDNLQWDWSNCWVHTTSDTRGRSFCLVFLSIAGNNKFGYLGRSCYRRKSDVNHRSDLWDMPSVRQISIHSHHYRWETQFIYSFRVLVIGRVSLFSDMIIAIQSHPFVQTGAGKTSLIKNTFGVTEAVSLSSWRSIQDFISVKYPFNPLAHFSWRSRRVWYQQRTFFHRRKQKIRFAW